jgi:hypothetical protein
MIRRLSAGLIAAAAFAFVAPLAATAKGYQPSMVDSTAIEGQFLIAGAGSKKACEAKGKSWKPRARGYWGVKSKESYCDENVNDTSKCSCQKS